MVTVETSNEILFSLENNTITKYIELVTMFLPLPPIIVKLKSIPKELLEKSQTKNLPLLQSGDDFISGTIPIIKYLIKSSKDIFDGINFNYREILYGKNIKEETKVDMWINFIFSKIFPITLELENQLYGKSEFDIRIFEYKLNDLLEILVEINEYLKLRTFLTSNHIQLCDIMLTCALHICYNDLFTKNEWELIPNVIRLFKFVSNLGFYKEVFGSSIPCKKVKKAEMYITPNNKEVKKENEQKKNKETKKAHK